MCTGLSDGCRTVMTRCAIAHDSSVAKGGGFEIAGYMTGAAVLRGRDVRWCFSGRFHTIVTRGAVAHDIGVIKDACRKAGDAVANAAVSRGLDMSR